VQAARAWMPSPYREGRGESEGQFRLRLVNPFPSMKAKRLLAVLERKPLGYRVARQSGSHRRMESPDYPPLTFAFHDKATIPAGLVRKILVRDVGLAEDEARKLL
jgi:predicted RNA binding protein YcfA (HicA-like mRNA interferase family)